ncbi:MAG: DUF2085 domain-containing protein [Anaerolineae bacterium]|nr:DUF2085 domain-containing protein [Anaerolineae bacterium]
MNTTGHDSLTRTPDRSARSLLPRPYARRTVRLVIGLAVLVGGLWLIGTPPGVLGKADAVGYAICHRIEARTYHVHDRQLPLCARCMGIYLGVMTGLAFFALRGRLRAGKLPPVRVLIVLLLFGAAVAVDGLNSYFSLFAFYQPVYMPHNTLRLVTGMGAGLVMISCVLPVFNTITWAAPRDDAPLRDFKDLAALLLAAGLVIAAVLTEVPALLVTAALISVIGVVLMFCLVGGTLFLSITRRENTITRWRELTIPALAGLVFALCLMGMIIILRYAATGTWDGFSLLG